MNQKQKVLLFFTRTIFKPKMIKTFNEFKTIKISRKDVFPIKETTFNVLKIRINGLYFYFRPIRKRKKFIEYLIELIEEYCFLYNPSKIFLKNKDLLIAIIKKNKSLFYNIGIVNDENSIVFNFLKTKNLSLLKMENLNEIPIKEILDFIQYLWGEIYMFKLNNGVGNNQYQTFSYNKIMASDLLASKLGLKKIFPNVSNIKLIIDSNYVLYGTLMEEADGISPSKIINHNELKISPNFQRYITSLNYMDVLSNEKDHRPGNYFIKLDGDCVTNLSVFDNDSPMSFFPVMTINMSSYWGSTKITNRKGLVELPFIDNELYDYIVSIKKRDFLKGFNQYLNFFQLMALWIRLKKLRKAIIKTSLNNTNFVLNKNDWSDETIILEKNIAYLNSYLNIFLFSKEKEKNYDMRNDI